MILLDAAIAGVLMYIFKIDSLISALELVCMITFLRMAMKLNGFIDSIYQAATELYLNKKENEEEM